MLRKKKYVCFSCLGLLLVGFSQTILSYQGGTHQKLTFIAAKKFNQCALGLGVERLTPLQVRYIAKTNVKLAERNIFSRVFNWRYYDRGSQSEKSFLWVLDTRFHKHFNEITLNMEQAIDAKARYSDLGRLVSYIQVVSSPAHSVPVFASRFWRFNSTDRFDRYPVNEEAVEKLLDCKMLRASDGTFDSILQSIASETLQAVISSIEGLPVTWEAFWQLADKDSNFGEYGPAGNNFGRKTEFACGSGTLCVLLKDDPLYEDFALSRHLSAAKGTMQALFLIQSKYAYRNITK